MTEVTTGFARGATPAAGGTAVPLGLPRPRAAAATETDPRGLRAVPAPRPAPRAALRVLGRDDDDLQALAALPGLAEELAADLRDDDPSDLLDDAPATARRSTALVDDDDEADALVATALVALGEDGDDLDEDDAASPDADAEAAALAAALGELDPDEAATWQERALCAQTDPEAFFPEKGGSTREAKRVCTSCDVRLECLDYALQNDERFGIWGGLSERERRRVKRQAG